MEDYYEDELDGNEEFLYEDFELGCATVGNVHALVTPGYEQDFRNGRSNKIPYVSLVILRHVTDGRVATCSLEDGDLLGWDSIFEGPIAETGHREFLLRGCRVIDRQAYREFLCKLRVFSECSTGDIMFSDYCAQQECHNNRIFQRRLRDWMDLLYPEGADAGLE